MSPNTYLEGGKFQLSQGNAKWSQVTSLANSNLEGGRGGPRGEKEQEYERGERRKEMKEVTGTPGKAPNTVISQTAYA